jgi:hypothetical protein
VGKFESFAKRFQLPTNLLGDDALLQNTEFFQFVEKARENLEITFRRLGRRALLYFAIEKRPGGSFCNNNNDRPFDVFWMRKIFEITVIFPGILKFLPAFG